MGGVQYKENLQKRLKNTDPYRYFFFPIIPKNVSNKLTGIDLQELSVQVRHLKKKKFS